MSIIKVNDYLKHHYEGYIEQCKDSIKLNRQFFEYEYNSIGEDNISYGKCVSIITYFLGYIRNNDISSALPLNKINKTNLFNMLKNHCIIFIVLNRDILSKLTDQGVE